MLWVARAQSNWPVRRARAHVKRVLRLGVGEISRLNRNKEKLAPMSWWAAEGSRKNLRHSPYYGYGAQYFGEVFS